MMAEEGQEGAPSAEGSQESPPSRGLLEEFLVEKEVHDHLRFLERHLDAFLLLEQFKERVKRGTCETATGSEGTPKGDTGDAREIHKFNECDEQHIVDLIENDPKFVESAFRRLKVAEVYRDLEHLECLDRLDNTGPETSKLISNLRKQVQKSRDKTKRSPSFAQTEMRDIETRKAADIQPSLLSRVLAQKAHPLLVSEHPHPWKEVVNDGRDLKIHIRNYKDNPEMISFRLEGTVAAPLICILSVLNEVDFFSQWVPYYTTPFKLGLRKVTNERLGRVDQVVQFHIDFPWPFANRDACFEVFAVDDFERNSQIVVKMLTLDNQYRTPRQRMNIPAPGSSVERIVVDGSLVIKPLSPHASFISLLWHENCRMRVPLVMADFVTKLFARSAFQAFRRTCEAARDGELKERREKNAFLYSFVQNRLAEVGLDVRGVYTPADDDHDEFFDAEEASE